MHRSDYGVILRPVGDDQLTYVMVKKLPKLPDNFTVVKFSYDVREPAYIDDNSYHTLKLYDDKDSRVAKVDIHDNVQSFIDLDLLLQEISTWIVITSPEAKVRILDSSNIVQVEQPPSSTGGSGESFHLRLRLADASCLG